MPCGCTQLLEPDPKGDFTICDNANSPAFTEHGIANLVSGSPVLSVTFVTEKVSSEYSFSELAVENLIDANPFSIVAEITARSTTFFTVSLDGLPDTSNYRLRWNVYITSLSSS